jgi:hypothetical protein
MQENDLIIKKYPSRTLLSAEYYTSFALYISNIRSLKEEKESPLVNEIH